MTALGRPWVLASLIFVVALAVGDGLVTFGGLGLGGAAAGAIFLALGFRMHPRFLFEEEAAANRPPACLAQRRKRVASPNASNSPFAISSRIIFCFRSHRR